MVPRRGFTLVELLITIMIIGILAAAVLGVAAVAGETAREARTRNLIARLHTLLMDHYDSYTSRRVKVNSNVLNAISNLNTSTALKGRIKAETRLYALRELMLMEVPDRWSDVLLANLGADSSPASTYTVNSPFYFNGAKSIRGRTPLANVYLRQYDRLSKAINKISGVPNTVGDMRANQGAECLYMVVMNACGDGEARTLFPESMIGDTDGDGANEFLDGWGHPIEFLRWAPGYRSDAQICALDLDNKPSPQEMEKAWMAAGSADHDPFDLYRAQPVAFRLLPLVFSNGRDEESGIVTDTGTTPWWLTNMTLNISPTPPYVNPVLNPYVKPAGGYLGFVADTSLATDNLNNHLIGTR